MAYVHSPARQSALGLRPWRCLRASLARRLVVAAASMLWLGVAALPTQAQSSLNLPPMTLIAAAADPARNTYVLGTFTEAITVGDKLLVSLGGTDYALVQYRPDGSVGWAISLGTAGDEWSEFTTLRVTSNALYVVGGTIGSLRLTDTAGVVVNTFHNYGKPAGGPDAFVLKFSLAGVAQWQATITSFSMYDHSIGLMLDAAGNVYWTGVFHGCCPSSGASTLRGGDGATLSLTGSSDSYGNAFLAKLSPAGTPLWAVKAYDRDAWFADAVTDSQGSLYVRGVATATVSGTPTTVVSTDGTTYSVPHQGGASAFLLKFNAAGVSQWATTLIGSPEFDSHSSKSCVTAGDEVVVGGSYNAGPLTFTSTDEANLQLPAGSGYDGFVAKYGSDGKAKWAVQIAGTDDQRV